MMKRLTDFCAHGVNVAMDSCSRCAAEVREFKAQREATVAELPIRHRAAIAAMQGLLASPRDVTEKAGLTHHQRVATAAVVYADALLEELAK